MAQPQGAQPQGAQPQGAAHSQPELPVKQANEHFNQPDFSKGKVSRPMVEQIAGSGVYFRVTILQELRDRIEVYFPAFEDDPAYTEWVWRCSSRIHRPSSGKWSYVGRGGWRYNVKSSKKRGRAKGGEGKQSQGQSSAQQQHTICDTVRQRDGCGTPSLEPSASDCSQATHSSGAKLGTHVNNAVALWFESHLRARRALAAAQSDHVVAMGPALPAAAARSQMRSSADVHSKCSAWSSEDATSARRHDEADTSMHPPPAKMHAAATEGKPAAASAACTNACTAHAVQTEAHAPGCVSDAEQPVRTQAEGKPGQVAAHTLSKTLAVPAAVDSADGKLSRLHVHDCSAEQNNSRRSSSTLEHNSADEQAGGRLCEA